MFKTVIMATTALTILGSSMVYAQQRAPERHRWQPSQEDMAAFSAARIAGLKAGLTLTPEQEKNWPAFESALQDMAKLRRERREARRTARAERRTDESRANPTERLRRRAENLAARGAALKKLADAQEPLYSSLDEAQKRRFDVLARVARHGMRHRHHHRHGMRHHGMRHHADGGKRGFEHRGEDRRGGDRWHRGRHHRDDMRTEFDAPRGPDAPATTGQGERL
jgi:hypothetical protein